MDPAPSSPLETVPALSATESSSTTGSESASTSPSTSPSFLTLQDNGSGRKVNPREEGNGCGGGVNTPRPPSGDSALLASQLQQLQDRLAEVEKQNEKNRSEQWELERAHCQDSAPVALGVMRDAQGLVEALEDDPSSKFYLRERYRRLRGRLFGDRSKDEIPEAQYISNALWVFEREMTRLKKDQESLNDLWQAREDLQEREKNWEDERRLLLQKQTELESKLKATSQETEAESDRGSPSNNDGNDDGRDECAPRPSIIEKPELTRVDWACFKNAVMSSRTEVFAIEILQGEPAIDWDWTQNHFYPTRRHRRGPPVKQGQKTKPRRAPTTLKSPSMPGQAPLPERIRVNSTYILKILEKIDSGTFSSDASIVMVRPYKALAYYEDAIRDTFHNLELLFGNQDLKEPKTVETLMVPEIKGEEPPTISVLEVQGANVSRSDAAESENEKDDSDQEGDVFTRSRTAYEHLQCLINFMDGDIRRKLDYLVHCRTVVFSDLWYLFKQGEEVIDHNQRQVYRIISMASPGHRVFPPWPVYRNERSSEDEDQETPLILNCVYIDFDGKSLGPVSRQVHIPRFDGEKPVTSLEVFPLRFADGGSDDPGETTFRQRMIARGKLFLSSTSFKHMHYSGWTLNTRDEVDSHVVVDFQEAFAAQENTEKGWRPNLETIIGQEPEEDKGDECNASCCQGENVHRDNYADTNRNREYMASLVPQDRRQEPSPVLLPRSLEGIYDLDSAFWDEDLLILSYRVFGFILRSRKWAQLDLTHLGSPRLSSTRVESGPPSVNAPSKDGIEHGNHGPPEASGTAYQTQEDKMETAFDQLVLPQGHKEMVESLIAQHFRDKDAARTQAKDDQQFDIVRGKGKGLIILLHGAPGVGKTSTAEGVAEMFRKPLFQITCGDLGTTAREVEQALEMHFTLANRWGCVLLLDEADVFLTARSKTDFIRNGLVSVFLRVMEYYAGVLFLTTNRVGDFDEAFASRIHISLYYPQLNEQSTVAIFRLNLKLIKQRFDSRGRKIDIDEPEIVEYARWFFNNHKEKWNGRQIRNACQTALALAEYRAQGDRSKQVVDVDAAVHLTTQDFVTVSNAYEHFMVYINEVRGADSIRYARLQKLRAQEIDILLAAQPVHTDARPQSAAQTTVAPVVPQSNMPNAQPMQPAPVSAAYAYPQYNTTGAPPPAYPYPYFPQPLYSQAPAQGPVTYGPQPGTQQGHPPDANAAAAATWPGQQHQQHQQQPPPAPQEQQYQQYQPYQQYQQHQQPPPQGGPTAN